jgi:hypothetical protein
MTDGDNDSVWVVTVPGQPQSTPLAYKYFYNAGDTWESGDNREVNTGTSATLTLPRYFFDLNPDYFNGRTPYTGITSTVTFNIDMHLPLRGAMETSDHVYIAGNFTDWGNGAIELLDANADSIYSVDVLLLHQVIWLFINLFGVQVEPLQEPGNHHPGLMFLAEIITGFME